MLHKVIVSSTFVGKCNPTCGFRVVLYLQGSEDLSLRSSLNFLDLSKKRDLSRSSTWESATDCKLEMIMSDFQRCGSTQKLEESPQKRVEESRTLFLRQNPLNRSRIQISLVPPFVPPFVMYRSVTFDKSLF